MRFVVGLIVLICIAVVQNLFILKETQGIFSGSEHGDAFERPLVRRSANNEEDFRLAYKQSFGFFTDISESNWKVAQQIHARAFPNHFGNEQALYRYANGPNDQGKIPKLKDSSWWNGNNFQEEFHCPYSERLPPNSEADGPKWVCDPHRIKTQKECLVYSVGSNGNVLFEKAVKDYIGSHCEIHTFDLAKDTRHTGRRKFKDFATELKKYSTFHHWGIAPEDQIAKYARQGLPMKTLQQTLRELGHINRTVDIFKIDCEWCEWFTFENWLEGGDLRQILVETHNAPMPNAKNFFYTLHDAGYVIFSKEANFPNGGGGVEFAFLKLSPDFFVPSQAFPKGTMYANIE